jgi:hypothetical protein
MQTTSKTSRFYHPRADGLTERAHRTIEQMLRSFVHQQHHDWLNCLSLAELAYNDNVRSANTFSPFEAIYGLNPFTPASLLTKSPISGPLDVIAKSMTSTTQSPESSGLPIIIKPHYQNSLHLLT